MNSVLIETHFLPSLEFFCMVMDFDSIELEHHEHYAKQSYRNHTLINTANGLHKLVVPITHKGNHTLMRDVKVDYSQNWVNNLWRTIESAYRKSPYYEHYSDDLHSHLFKNYTFLIDLNQNLLKLCFQWLRLEKEITPTEGYNKTTLSTDLRNVLLSKKPYSNRNFYGPFPYTQVFGYAFMENLSIVDLIFCKGPESGGIITASRLNL